MTLDADNSQRLDAAGVDSLVRAHQAELLCYARSMVRDEEAARDIVQETFLRLWKSPPRPGAVRAWLYRVCRSRAIDYLRHLRSGAGKQVAMEPALIDQSPDSAPAPDRILQHREDADRILRHLAALPERQRELLRLKFQAGLSYKEIAEATGLSVTNVGFILHSALTALRERFANPRSL